MRSIREILRLSKQCGMSHRQISKAVSVSPSTVGDYLSRAKVAGLSWPLPEHLDDTTLDALLFPPQPLPSSARPEPDYRYVHRELRKKGVTKLLLWQEYKESNPDGFQYSQFCERYKDWRGTVNVTMRLDHKAGHKVFSDFAGKKLRVTDRETGEIKNAHIFVCAMGASSYFFAEAFMDESTESWCAGHVAAFSHFGGSASVIVPDNPKAAIIQPCKYEPVINSAFLEMASHYSCAVIPARVRRPKDKAYASYYMSSRRSNHTSKNLLSTRVFLSGGIGKIVGTWVGV